MSPKALEKAGPALRSRGNRASEARRRFATCHPTHGAAPVTKPGVLFSSLLEPAAGGSVPPVIFSAGGRVARRYSSPKPRASPGLLSDTWPTDPPWRGLEALKA